MVRSDRLPEVYGGRLPDRLRRRLSLSAEAGRKSPGDQVSGTDNALQERTFLEDQPNGSLLERNPPTPTAPEKRILADVAIDIISRDLGNRLFTYGVPEHLKSEVFIGSQVLVPFGKQNLVPAFVIDLSDCADWQASTAARQEPVLIKDIVEVLESAPIFDRSYINFLYFVADYYAAPISEVISACVPSDLSARLKKIVRICPGLDTRVPLPPKGTEQLLIYDSLQSARQGYLSLRALRQKTGLNQSKFYTYLCQLRQKGLIKVEQESSPSPQPKVVQSVIWTRKPASSQRQESIVQVLRQAGGQLALARLIEQAHTSASTINRMCQLGILTRVQEEILRDPLSHLLLSPGTKAALPTLTSDQRKVLSVLEASLDERLSEEADSPDKADPPWLLHGVTGSGKTEIYLRLIARTLSKGRTALMLVPEISLTPQLAERLVARFGENVAVWHSALSQGERYDTWRRLQSGQARVLLGARSAVLTDLNHLGLIILDEEHDSSYKQSSPSPRYHARHLARERCQRSGALLLLGSATPDVGSYAEARSNNHLLELPERVFKQEMPESHLVDMRREFALGNYSIFSDRLTVAVKDCLKQGKQAILLINRRGFASHVLCRACGYVLKCRNCSVSLTFHQSKGKGQDGYLICHHCAFRSGAAEICPSCKSPFIRQFGLGTQRVEQEVRECFPEARLLRLDSDITRERGAADEIFAKFASGQADILIGTQMVSKGLDIENVVLVGVLAADAAFNLPDYRSLERGFQLLTQVSGRAGRGKYKGQVILQTYNLELPALLLAQRHDYKTFAEQELASRQSFEYPPFSQLIRIVFSADEETTAQSAAEQLAEALSVYLEDKVQLTAIKILGPAPCLIERLRGKFRFHVIVKNLCGAAGRKLLGQFLFLWRVGPGVALAIDIDAQDML